MAGLLLAALAWMTVAAGTVHAQEDGSSASAVFEVESLNAGLAPAEGRIDRSTPRATMEGFIDAADAGDYRRAAQFLNLSALDEEEQRRLGPDLARRLHEVIKRKVWIDWTGLPDRTDGLDAFSSGKNPMAGKPRRSLQIAVLEPGLRPVDIRMERVRPAGGEPQWVFAARTVSRIDRLYDAFGPGELEDSLPDWAKEEAVRGIPWWQFILLPLLLALAGLVAWAAYWLSGLMRRPAGSQAWISTALERIRLPIAIFAGTVVANLLISTVLTFSGPINAILSPILAASMILAVALGILRIIDTALDYVSDRYVASIDDEENAESRRLYTNISVARRIVILVALLIGAGVLAIQLNLSQTLGVSLLASAGVLSLVFGFAAQEVLGNILASIQIAFAKSIRIGDAVFYEGRWGYVEEINYTFVLIRVWDQRRVVVPVRYFISHPFENWSIRNARLVQTIELTLDYPTDVEKLRNAFEGFLRADEDYDGETEPATLVIGQNEFGVIVRFTCSAKDPTAAFYLQCRMREKLMDFIRQEGMKVYPVERQISSDEAAA